MKKEQYEALLAVAVHKRNCSSFGCFAECRHGVECTGAEALPMHYIIIYSQKIDLKRNLRGKKIFHFISKMHTVCMCNYTLDTVLRKFEPWLIVPSARQH